MDNYDVVIIGGGPAGVAAAYSCFKNGVDSILIIERDGKLGSVLNQCVQNGFGIHNFKEDLTGPEYIQKYINNLRFTNIKIKLNANVIDISKELEVTYVSSFDGLNIIKAKAIILSTGCREINRGALNIPGYRPSGIFPAGTAQKLINVDGLNIGKNVAIFGSSNIGLIMARRLVLEGLKVSCVVEPKPYSTGLKGNIVQCLDDYNIPLLLSHTIVKINGKDRIYSIVVAKVDEQGNIIKDSEIEYECDTLLISCGLLPENKLAEKLNIELSSITGGPVISNNFETNIKGIFSCGNSLYIHDFVDDISKEAEATGKAVAFYVKDLNCENEYINIVSSGGVKYTIPHKMDLNNLDNDLIIRLRVDNMYNNKSIVVKAKEKEIKRINKKSMSICKMEEIRLKKDELKDINNSIINIFLEDNNND